MPQGVSGVFSVRFTSVFQGPYRGALDAFQGVSEPSEVFSGVKRDLTDLQWRSEAFEWRFRELQKGLKIFQTDYTSRFDVSKKF